MPSPPDPPTRKGWPHHRGLRPLLFSHSSVGSLTSHKKGARDGAVVRALAFYQCGLGSNPGVDAICGFSLLLVLFFTPRSFSPGTPVFPSPQKPIFPNSNSTRNKVDEKQLCECANFKSLFIYLFNYYLQEQISESAVRRDLGFSFSSLSEKTRKSNHLRMSKAASAFFSVTLLKSLSVSPGVWTRDLTLSRPAFSQLS